MGVLLGLVCALAQDGGKLDWGGGDPRKAMQAAREAKRPILLYFTSRG